MRELIDRELDGAAALLIRNLQSFGISDAQEFAQLTSSLGYDLFEYVSLARHVVASFAPHNSACQTNN